MSIDAVDDSVAMDGSFSCLPWAGVSTGDITCRIKTAAFLTASYLTDPICKSHEFYRRLFVVNEMNPTSWKAVNVMRQFFLLIGIVTCAYVAVFTTLPGIALRSLAAYVQRDSFIHYKGDAPGKILPNNHTFSLLSWNVCCAVGGYMISDGGVFPESFRIDEVINKIIEKDADVNCLYEVFDVQTAVYIREKLKEKGYAHLYYNIGTKAIGVSSGILIASKYEIKNPEFTQFPQDMLVGRTKNAAKGVFAFDLHSRGEEKGFARIYSTHLQHSEECASPTDEEREARRKQMQIIMEKIEKIAPFSFFRTPWIQELSKLPIEAIVITGDLNLDDDEYYASSWHHHLQKGDTYRDPKRTWGGDKFCADLVGNRFSPPLNLDHTAIVKGTARGIRTSLVETGYDATKFKREALSDHAGLFSEISV